MNDFKTKNNDPICKSASKAFSQLVAHEQNLKKCRITLGDAFEKVNSDNSNAIAVTKKQVEFCKKLDEKKAIPSSPWIKVEAEGGGFLAQHLGASNKKPRQSWKKLIVHCINGKSLVQFLFQKVVTHRAIVITHAVCATGSEDARRLQDGGCVGVLCGACLADSFAG